MHQCRTIIVVMPEIMLQQYAPSTLLLVWFEHMRFSSILTLAGSIDNRKAVVGLMRGYVMRANSTLSFYETRHAAHDSTYSPVKREKEVD